MKTTMSVRTIFHCSLERAFKTPMLCDITQVHTGFLVMPRVTHCEGDENWGKPGFSKKVFLAKTLMFKGGEASKDTVIERMENEYWKIEVNDFKVWMLGFSRFVGEWRTTELAPNEIQIDYTYTMHSDSVLLYPLNWLFTKIFWRIYMKRVLENIRRLVNSNAPYLHA